MQFNHFLVVDEEPLLYHTGMRRMFPQVLEAVARVIDPATLRWIRFGHLEVDECGSLNEWLRVAPRAQALAGLVGTLVNLNDFAEGRPRVLTPDDAQPGAPADVATATRREVAPDCRRRIARRAPLAGLSNARLGCPHWLWPGSLGSGKCL